MIAHDNIQWKPLGKGRIAPADSIADKVLAAKLAEYKSQVAGKYRSVAPENIGNAFHSGEYIVSPKIDGETWFLSASKGAALLLSPSGKIISDVPVTNEAIGLISNKSVLFAGELYANGKPTRAHVHDLHASLGGGVNAKIDRLHFAAFDMLEFNGIDYQKQSFKNRVTQLSAIMSEGQLCPSAAFGRNQRLETGGWRREVGDGYLNERIKPFKTLQVSSQCCRICSEVSSRKYPKRTAKEI